jgi:hypothetical protein
LLLRTTKCTQIRTRRKGLWYNALRPVGVEYTDKMKLSVHFVTFSEFDKKMRKEIRVEILRGIYRTNALQRRRLMV